MVVAPANVLNRRLSVILYADIHGYSRLVDQDESGTIMRLKQSLTMIRHLVGDYGGNVVNTAGDGVVAVFPSASQALHFAVEMQREMSNASAWMSGQEPIFYRIGIAMGETIIGDDGVYGHCVNLAARIQALAEPGGICITDNVHNIVRNQSDLKMRSLGKQSLKNIAEAVEVYVVDRESARTTRRLCRFRCPLPRQGGWRRIARSRCCPWRTSPAMRPIRISATGSSPISSQICAGSEVCW